MNKSAGVLGNSQFSISADVLFNDVLSDLEFKLAGLVLKAFWLFAN